MTTLSPAAQAVIEDFNTPFVPPDLINIGSDYGNIGRFYWSNQMTFRIQQWGEDFYEETAFELPGVGAFLWTKFDWVGWVMGGFDHE